MLLKIKNFFRGSLKKGQYEAIHLTGKAGLKEKIGPVSIKNIVKTKISYNSVEAQQLETIIFDYLSPTLETTLIEIGCNFGILSLMLSQVRQ